MKLYHCFKCVFLFVVMFAATILVLAVFLDSWLLSAADEPVESDYAFVLAGKPFRALEAADLYKEGLVKKIYVSKPFESMERSKFEKMGIIIPRKEWLTQQVLLRSGVPLDDILFFGTNSLSTVEEILAIKKMVTRSNAKFMVVTSPYHVRRTKMILSDYFKEHSYRVILNRHENMAEPWWTQQSSALQVVLEVSKIFYYNLGGMFLSGDALTGS